MLKQTLGWTTPKLRTPEQGDRWTWLILAAYTQLRLARDLATSKQSDKIKKNPLTCDYSPVSGLCTLWS